MHSPAMIIVANHIFELQAEAAANRMANEAKQAKRHESRSSNRIAAALISVRSLFGNATEGPRVLPNLKDYPYRS